jgi:hypothetical protein
MFAIGLKLLGEMCRWQVFDRFVRTRVEETRLDL